MSTDGSGFSADRLSVALELLSWDVEWRRPDRDLDLGFVCFLLVLDPDLDLDRFLDLDLLSFRRITGDLDRVLLDLLTDLERDLRCPDLEHDLLLDLLRRDLESDRCRRLAEWDLDLDRCRRLAEWDLDLDRDLRLPSRSVALFCLGILTSLFLNGNGSWHRPL